MIGAGTQSRRVSPENTTALRIPHSILNIQFLVSSAIGDA